MPSPPPSDDGAPAEEVAAGAARLDALRRRVLNVVGHELRTPVTTVRGLAEALAAGPAEPDRSEIVAALVRTARRAERLLDDLLVATGVDTALPVAGEVEVDVVAEVRAAVAESASPESVTVRSRPAVAVLRDGTARRILDPLVDNAVKYGEGEAVVEVERTGDCVEVVITTARATPPEDLELAFEPFWRGEAAVMTAPGLGVGLALARALVEVAGGRLSLEVAPGGGVVTRLRLRAAEAA